LAPLPKHQKGATPVPITLGSVAFDDKRTAVEEQMEEVGGRDARRIVLRGLVRGITSMEAVEARLDAIAEAASKSDYTAALSIRAGRRYWVRRARYKRAVSRLARFGTFELTLEARDPFEESCAETTAAWSIAESGATLPLATAGNAETLPVITLVATGDVVGPSLEDGVRRLTYNGTVEDGQTLVIDGPAQRLVLDGEDVTPYAQGGFPGIYPEGTTLRYEDDASSSHTAEAVVAYRDRWW
jgi:hypothetical protein